jgi:hypothetical protein
MQSRVDSAEPEAKRLMSARPLAWRPADRRAYNGHLNLPSGGPPYCLTAVSFGWRSTISPARDSELI